jgi:hypothetical protein
MTSTLQKVIALADGFRRALRRVEQAQKMATSIERDHHADPTERLAIAVVTRDGRVAELWRYVCAELAEAEVELGELLKDVDHLGDSLGSETLP